MCLIVSIYYREGRIKFNVIEENGLLSYRENISYFYTPKDGERDLDVNVTTVNPVYFVSFFEWKANEISLD